MSSAPAPGPVPGPTASPVAHELAPAKINFGLRVGPRQTDGYHPIESLFLPLNLADEIAVEAGPGSEVRLALQGAPSGVPAGGDNLAARAARAFLEAAGLEAELRIRLRKRIPAAAGLGGGSSDAGAVLRALDRLYAGALAPERLAGLALELGADVPFFLDPRPALASGVGQRLQPVAGAPELALLLVNPGIPLATADVYRAFDALRKAPGGAGTGALTPFEPGSTMRRLSGLRDTGGWLGGGTSELSDLLVNDLEAAATRLCPAIRRLRARLEASGARAVAISGSGPTLFGIFPNVPAARAAAERAGFESPGSTVWFRVAVTQSS